MMVTVSVTKKSSSAVPMTLLARSLSKAGMATCGLVVAVKLQKTRVFSVSS